MADVKKVLAIDVDDRAFKAFIADFSKFSTQLQKAPSEWAKFSKEVKASQQAMAAITRQHAAVASHAKSAEHWWSRISGHVKTVAGHVVSISKSLLAWTGLGSIFGGLAGLGGFMSFVRMGESAVAQRHVALGRGSTTGGETAFQRVFSPILDQPSAMLEGIARAKTSAYAPERQALASLGITNLRGDTAQIAARAMASFMRRTRGLSEEQLGPFIDPRQLGLLGLTPSAGMRAREYDPAELLSRFEKQRKAADIPKSVSKVWEDFIAKLDEASDKIQTTLINKFVEWAPVLKDITEQFTNMLNDALKGDAFANMLKFVREQLEKFHRWLSSGEAEKDIADWWNKLKEFAAAVGEMTEAVVAAAQRMGLVSTPASRLEEEINRQREKTNAERRARGEAEIEPPQPEWRTRIRRFLTGRQHGGAVGAGQEVLVGERGPEWVKFNRSGRVIPAGFTEALVAGESGGNYRIVNRYSGALGKYQVMPGNVASWTRLALGYSMTPAQFLASNQAQDAVFIDQMTRNFAKYGTIEDAASIWFTGRPYAQAVRERARDMNKTVQQYVAEIKARMGGKSLQGMVAQMARTPFGADRNVAPAAGTAGGGIAGMSPYESFIDQLVRAMAAKAGMNITVEPSPGAHVILGAHMSGPGRRLVG